MDAKDVIKSQYLASLEMLRQTVIKCPDDLWDNPADKNKFWHIAYHAIFYTHFYLQPAESDFVPWAKQRPNYQFMGTVPWPPYNEPEIDEPYLKEEVLEYLSLCNQEVETQIDAVDLEAAESGFEWLPFGKLELQFYNIRHLQHHIGELCERLWAVENIEVGWVGRKTR